MAHDTGRFEFFAGQVRQPPPRTIRNSVQNLIPPTLVANLLLKRCDGRRTARELMADLRLDERVFLDELKLLVRTHWLAFAGGAEVFDRIAAE